MEQSVQAAAPLASASATSRPRAAAAPRRLHSGGDRLGRYEAKALLQEQGLLQEKTGSSLPKQAGGVKVGGRGHAPPPLPHQGCPCSACLAAGMMRFLTRPLFWGCPRALSDTQSLAKGCEVKGRGGLRKSRAPRSIALRLHGRSWRETSKDGCPTRCVLPTAQHSRPKFCVECNLRQAQLPDHCCTRRPLLTLDPCCWRTSPPLCFTPGITCTWPRPGRQAPRLGASLLDRQPVGKGHPLKRPNAARPSQAGAD